MLGVHVMGKITEDRRGPENTWNDCLPTKKLYKQKQRDELDL